MKVLSKAQVEGLILDYEVLERVGSSLGSGGIIVMDDTTCMVRALMHMVYFYHDASCGQCTPCREGTGWVCRLLEQIIQGNGSVEMVGKLREVASKIEGRTICAFGEAVSWPVTSFIDLFYEEFVYYAREGRSCTNSRS